MGSVDKTPRTSIRSLCRRLSASALIAALLLAVAPHVGASWFVDAGRFHVSVHGQISCTDCHVSTPQEERHPNPADVNKSVRDFFRTEKCARCHEDIVVKMDSGTHAGKPVDNRQEYNFCVNCHDPHYQLATKNLAASFDPSKPVNQQCGACHKLQTSLPTLSLQDEKCMACHRSVGTEGAETVRKVSDFCFACHGTESNRKNTERVNVTGTVPIIESHSYTSTTHSKLSCLVCHPKSAEFGHTKRERTPCLSCHHRHDEKIAHDAHLRVSCEACHIAGAIPVKNAASGTILWQIDRKTDRPIDVHNMTLTAAAGSCERCHNSANVIGAAAMVLPPKSIICMPCHAATLSIADTTSMISLLVLLFGLIGLAAVWFSGNVSASGKSTIERGMHKPPGNTRRFFFVIKRLYALKTIALDVLLQRRLFRQSRTRWFIHALIFFPFMFRFLWGMTALLTSLWIPQSSLPWTLLDKDYPPVALSFDASGLSILFGVILIALRRIVVPNRDMAGIPKQDWLALFLIGATVVVGFVLEGVRIAMQGSPAGSEYAFLGYAISRVFEQTSALPGAYGYLWYFHAIATGAVLAYLPFSHLLHIIVAPVVLSMNAVTVSLKNPVKGSAP
ncbi:cytochrome c3 family protein [Desulfomonile tiedjei]|uniref:Nitrate reductase gamma subunit n=1 Tax=Desulfomonile tiedjei (strain ATCC 49306 / DSM 6799 / DCB-1) TaxID=706587 RepID=I4C1N1_DESTA|nr:cytochrome c3 family protein [Desulfomonile tiedjei]AFM23472.1 nitrate reductase gamma subunit [Desulfomonile tiedjei DSM 6799]